MKIKCLGSGSSGNCYLLQSDTETLILDCGLPIMEIKKGLNFDLSKVHGCVVTHTHVDHSKSVKDFENMGIPVYKPYESKEPILLNCWSGIVQSFDLTDKDGNWTHTNADGSECPCYGFLIKHPELGRMLYITDTELVKWKFNDIDHILISCNYQKKYVTDDEQTKRKHVLKGHMELQTVIDFLNVNATDRLKTVTLCHLSDRNSNAKEMVDEVQKIVPWANVSVAKANTEVVLSEQCPF